MALEHQSEQVVRTNFNHDHVEQRNALDDYRVSDLSTHRETFRAGSQSSSLPSLTLVDAPTDYIGGAGRITKDIANGVIGEVLNHPGRLALNAAEGVAIGAGLVAASALAPVVGTAALIAGGAYAGYKLATNAGEWWQAGKVVSNPSLYSQSELNAADRTLTNIGSGAAEMIAGGVGLKLTVGALVNDSVRSVTEGMIKDGYVGARAGYQTARDGVSEGATFVAGKASNGAGYVAEKASNGFGYVAEKASNGVGYVAEKASNGASYVADKASGGASYVAEKASSGAGYVAEKASNGVGYVAEKASKGASLVSERANDGASYLANQAKNAGNGIVNAVDAQYGEAAQKLAARVADGPLAQAYSRVRSNLRPENETSKLVQAFNKFHDSSNGTLTAAQQAENEAVLKVFRE